MLYLQNRLATGEKPRAKWLCIPVLAQATSLGLQGLLPSTSPEMELLQGLLLMLEHTEAGVRTRPEKPKYKNIYSSTLTLSHTSCLTSINCFKQDTEEVAHKALTLL